MWAETNASGGATFRFTLPAAPPRILTDAAQGKVYVIDDDAAMRDSLDFLLDSAGFNVRLFDSAQVFLDELPSLESGCVVTDVRMPGIDGMELLRQLKAGPQHASGHRHDRPWRRAARRRGDEARRASIFSKSRSRTTG